MNEEILSCLIGLCGAVSNNDKTENTDQIMLDGLRSLYAETDISTVCNCIRDEKFHISPSCLTCKFPCGNTSDYDMTVYHNNLSNKALKDEMMNLASRLAEKENLNEKQLELLYKAVAYFGYDLEKVSYQEMIERLKENV